MKKSVYIILSALAVSLCCAGCGKQSSIGADENKEMANQINSNASVETDEKNAGDKLKVIASFYPMYDFAKKIGGEKVEVINMVPAGTEPHDWEPAATDIRELETADVFVYNGAGMEHWVENILESLDNQKLTTVEASKGLKLMEETHSHEGDGKTDAESETDDKGKINTEGETEEASGCDPHVWLDPMNAKSEMENIKNAFVATDPENKDYYEKNYETYAAEFIKLDQEYREGIAKTASKDLIAAHEAFGYLCKAYGLNQIGIEGLLPDSEPDPARMNMIIQFARENNVKTIFFEELVSPKVAKTIASEIGAKTEVLNPLEGLSDEELSAGADYFSVMRDNLKTLEEALK